LSAVPRIFVPPHGAAWRAGLSLTLPEGASRHLQVLRMQPGDALLAFDGTGGQWQAQVQRMGRKDVDVELLAHEPVERELRVHVHLLLSLTANERMDAVVEKATELGAARITPVLAQRSVLRLSGERAAKRVAHWQGIATSACEQCGRNRVPVIDAIVDADAAWGVEAAQKWLFSLAEDSQAFAQRWLARPSQLALAVGPEGGWSPAEEAKAREAGWLSTHLGARVLRADTAPLAALGLIALNDGL
jgi:16S rRNA (uracil1498-N3)-methyltransferase